MDCGTKSVPTPTAMMNRVTKNSAGTFVSRPAIWVINRITPPTDCTTRRKQVILIGLFLKSFKSGRPITAPTSSGMSIIMEEMPLRTPYCSMFVTPVVKSVQNPHFM